MAGDIAHLTHKFNHESSVASSWMHASFNRSLVDVTPRSHSHAYNWICIYCWIRRSVKYCKLSEIGEYSVFPRLSSPTHSCLLALYSFFASRAFGFIGDIAHFKSVNSENYYAGCCWYALMNNSCQFCVTLFPLFLARHLNFTNIVYLAWISKYKWKFSWWYYTCSIG